MRTRLFHLTTSDKKPGLFASGMYPNDAVKIENGVWKFEVVAIDEPYFGSKTYADGWAHVTPQPMMQSASPPPLMQKLIDKLPPDVPLVQLKQRYHTFFRADIANWPDIKPMWFSYKNPVSGRVPPYLLPGSQDLRSAAGGALAFGVENAGRLAVEIGGHRQRGAGMEALHRLARHEAQMRR